MCNQCHLLYAYNCKIICVCVVVCVLMHDANHLQNTHNHTSITDIWTLGIRNQCVCYTPYNLAFVCVMIWHYNMVFVWWHMILLYGYAVRITSPVCPLVLSTVHQLACCIIFDIHYNLVNTMYITVRYTAFAVVMLCEIWYISYEINPQITCATISIVTQYIYI